METVYLVCAAVGGSLLLCQLLLAVLGLGHHGVDHDHDFAHDHDHDVEHDNAASWFVGILTFRGVTSALTFFGLGGLAAWEASLQPPLPLVIAGASGLAVLFLIAKIMKNLHRLKADGTVRIDRAIGKNGTVYLSVPGNQTGAGKVTVKLQNRTVEYLAVTRHESLATGTPVQIVAVVSSNTVEIVPVPQAQRITHV